MVSQRPTGNIVGNFVASRKIEEGRLCDMDRPENSKMLASDSDSGCKSRCAYMMLALSAFAWLALMEAGVHRGLDQTRLSVVIMPSGKLTGMTAPKHHLQQVGRLLLASPPNSEAEQDVKKPFRWTAKNVVSMVLAYVVGALANAVGVGGGAFFVPLFFWTGFSLKGSTALSQAIITGGAVASVGSALGGRHPVDPGKPLIDFGTALMLTPVLLLGVSLGVLLNVLFPDWLITFMLTILLIWLTIRIALKSRALYKKEKETRAAASAATSGVTEMVQQRNAQGASLPPTPPPRPAGSAAPGGSPNLRVHTSSLAERQKPAGGPRLRRIGRADSGRLSLDTAAAKKRASLEGIVGGDASAADGTQPPIPDGMFIKAAAPGAGDAELHSQSEHGGMAFENIPAIGAPPALAPSRSLPTSTDALPRPPSPFLTSLGAGSVGEHQWGEDGSSIDLQLGTDVPQRPPSAASRRSGDVALDIPPLVRGSEPRWRFEGDAGLSEGGGGSGGGPGFRGHDGSTHGSREGSSQPGGISGGSSDTEAGLQNGETAANDGQYQHGEAEDAAAPGFPFLQLLEVFVLWGAFLGLQLGKSRFPRCSIPYFLIFAAQAVLSLAANVLFTWRARKAAEKSTRQRSTQQLLRQEGAYEEPTSWSLPSLVRCSIVTLVGGSIAGLLGIGGGMIVSPLLLELGVHPLVAAATSSLMVLFSASTAALAFAFDHLLNVQFALIYGLGCFVSSLAGVWLVKRAVRRSGRASYVVIILAGIIGLGALLTAILGGKKAIEALSAGKGIGFRSFCSG